MLNKFRKTVNYIVNSHSCAQYSINTTYSRVFKSHWNQLRHSFPTALFPIPKYTCFDVFPNFSFKLQKTETCWRKTANGIESSAKSFSAHMFYNPTRRMTVSDVYKIQPPISILDYKKSKRVREKRQTAMNPAQRVLPHTIRFRIPLAGWLRSRCQQNSVHFS